MAFLVYGHQVADAVAQRALVGFGEGHVLRGRDHRAAHDLRHRRLHVAPACMGRDVALGDDAQGPPPILHQQAGHMPFDHAPGRGVDGARVLDMQDLRRHDVFQLKCGNIVHGGGPYVENGKASPGVAL